MDSRTTISATVRHLMIDNDMSNAELADLMGNSSSYMPRKINEGRWTVDELDVLAEIFRLRPADFLLGYQNIKESNEFPTD